jgi:hypothetical protein
MKKTILSVSAAFAFLWSSAQLTTVNSYYYKVKMGHKTQLNKAMASHNARFRPAGSPNAVVAYNVFGGEHNNEVLVIGNLGKSFKDRDLMAPASPEALDDLYTNIHSHLEDITAGDVLVYRKEYSNAAFDERAEKTLSTVYYLKPTVGKEFWDVVRKLPAVWDKAGMRIAGYTTQTGSTRLVLTRRMPNGWSELDENKDLAKAYDEVYGKGAYDREIQVFRNGVERRDAMMLTMNKEMSSK